MKDFLRKWATSDIVRAAVSTLLFLTAELLHHMAHSMAPVQGV